MWYIDSRLDYREPDEAEFWAAGEDVLDKSLAMFDLALKPTDRVLDLGCGIGRVTRAIANRVEAVVGVDVSAEMIEQGRRAMAGVRNVQLVLGNGRDLSDIKDDSFDVAYSFVTFQHIPDPDVICSYIVEMGRVLKPGGWALFQHSDDPSVHQAARQGWEGNPQSAGSPSGRGPRGCSEPQWAGVHVPKAQVDDALEKGGLMLDGRNGEGTLFCFVLAHAM